MDRAAIPEQLQPALAAPSIGTSAAASVEAGGVVWRGDGRVIRELLEGGLPTADEAAFGNSVAVVKSGPHRSVYRIGLPSGPFFLKHFKTPDWRALIRNILGRSPAEREAAAAARVQAAGIDTTVPSALGTTRNGPFVGDSFLVTAEIPNVRPLNEIIRERVFAAQRLATSPAAGRFRHKLACALGRLVGRLHRHGLTHGDLHPANILVQILPDGELRLWLIDLQRVRRPWLLSLWRARGDLFGLYNSFNGLAGRSERRRFLAAYWSEATSPDSRLLAAARRRGTDHLRTIARRLEAFCVRALRREQIQNDRKWQRPHRRLIVADRGWQRARGLSTLGSATILKFRDDPDALFQSGTIRFWRRRSSDGRTAVIDLVLAGKTLTCDVRETTRPLGWRDFFFRGGWSETRRAWEMGHALVRRRIGAVRPLLYIRARTLASVREFLVTEPTEGLVPLAFFLAHRLPNLTPAEREDWIENTSRRLAAQLARLHDFSLAHGQLSTANLLVGVEPEDCRIQFAATEHIMRKRRLTANDVVVELARLAGSLAGVPAIRLTQRARFLRTYLGAQFAAGKKQIWSAVSKQLTATAVVGRALPHTAPARTAAPIRCDGAGQGTRPDGEPNNSTRPGTSFARASLFLAAIAVATSLCAGCQSIDRPITLPVRYSVPGDQLLVLSDFKLQKDHELIRELNKLREQVTTILDLPVKRDPVVVYLFNNETEYRRYMSTTYPRLPPRSAYFVGTTTELAVYTHWGQNVREDLRHEYTHGLLHSGLKRVPLWLDEGLAEYFEVAGPQPGGANHDYARRLGEAVASGWRPDIKRLENLDDSAQMKRADYQEAWAWVHYMLNSTPQAKQVLISYLNDLRTNQNPKPISRRLLADVPEYDAQFASYVSKLPSTPQTASTSGTAL
jgi:tRNA A-37 threonylcarbamoyl transferase component Bud32